MVLEKPSDDAPATLPVAEHPTEPPHWAWRRRVSRLLFLALAYFLSARLGLEMSYTFDSISLFWPPTGIAIGALLRWGLGYWPGLYLGAMAATGFHGLGTAALIAIGNTLGPVLAVALLRALPLDPGFHNRRDVFGFLLMVPLAMTIPPTGGLLAILPATEIASPLFLTAWITWWLGDTVGALLFAPLILGFDRAVLRRALREQGRELFILLLATVAGGGVVFFNPLATGDHAVTLLLLLFPMLVWAGLRFPLWIVVLTAALLAALAALAALQQAGPFRMLGQQPGHELVWLFTTTTTAIALLVAALQGERHQFEQDLHAYNRFYRSATLITTRLAQAPLEQLDQAIRDMLVLLGDYSGADRVYVFDNDWQRHEWNDRYEWCAPGITAQINQLQNVPFDTFPGLIDRFQRGEMYLLRNLDDMPPEHALARPLLAEQGIQSLVMYPLLAGGVLLGFSGYDAVRAPRLWSEQELALLKLAADTLAEALQRQQQHRALQLTQHDLREANARLTRALAELECLADTDKLTGLWNRRKFDALLHSEVERCHRYHQPLALILFDLDHFKHINDKHGHIIGDQVLTSVAQTVTRHLRASDTLARWGGEEFVILTPLRLNAAVALAEKMRQLIADQPIPPVGAISASLGVAELNRSESGEDLLRRADAALYRAKATGRNRVAAAGD